MSTDSVLEPYGDGNGDDMFHHVTSPLFMFSKLKPHIAPFLYKWLLYLTTPSYKHIGRLARMSVLDTEVDGSNPSSSMLFP